MPIYAYQCQACAHAFDVMQKMSDPAPTVCPACNHGELRKQLSAAGFQLKGKGWYATDFKGGGSPLGGDKDASAPNASAPKESGSDTSSSGGGACGGCSTP